MSGTVSGSISPPTLSCDDECRGFRRLLASWPLDKPKAAVVVLLRLSIPKTFELSSRLFSDNFNDAYRYPVIVFHEETMNTEAYRQKLRSLSKSRLYFQAVRFDIPSFVNQSAVPKRACTKTIGYRHMCRFHAKTLYEQPILDGLKYVWRLDDDSFITKPIRYDVFRLMRDGRILYAYRSVVLDNPGCIMGLWSAVNNYTRRRAIRPKFRWTTPHVFYNNFEVSDLDVWRSTEYRDYIEYIDKTGGIYYRRWGDAPIKTLAVTLFVPKDRIHQFRDIGYKHGRRWKP